MWINGVRYSFISPHMNNEVYNNAFHIHFHSWLLRWVPSSDYYACEKPTPNTLAYAREKNPPYIKKKITIIKSKDKTPHVVPAHTLTLSCHQKLYSLICGQCRYKPHSKKSRWTTTIGCTRITPMVTTTNYWEPFSQPSDSEFPPVCRSGDTQTPIILFEKSAMYILSGLLSTFHNEEQNENFSPKL